MKHYGLSVFGVSAFLFAFVLQALVQDSWAEEKFQPKLPTCIAQAAEIIVKNHPYKEVKYETIEEALTYYIKKYVSGKLDESKIQAYSKLSPEEFVDGLEVIICNGVAQFYVNDKPMVEKNWNILFRKLENPSESEIDRLVNKDIQIYIISISFPICNGEGSKLKISCG